MIDLIVGLVMGACLYVIVGAGVYAAVKLVTDEFY